MGTTARAFAAHDAHAPLTPLDIERREPAATELRIEISSAECAIPIYTRRATKWGLTKYRAVLGYEIVGRVIPSRTLHVHQCEHRSHGRARDDQNDDSATP